MDCIEGYSANGSEAVLEAVNTAGFHKTQGENSAPTIQDVQALQGIEEKGFGSAAPQSGFDVDRMELEGGGRDVVSI